MFENVNHKALEDRWDIIVKKLRLGFDADIPSDMMPINDTDLSNFLGLLKQFLVARVSIKTAAASLFTYSKVIPFRE